MKVQSCRVCDTWSRRISVAVMEVHRGPEPTEHHRSSSPQCHCVSVRTDMSKGLPPTFGPEQKDESPTEPQESCSECEKSLVVQRLVCGHGLCADCSSSARYCPQCGKKLKLSDQFTFSDKPQAAFKRSLIGRCSSVSEGREEAECTSSLEKVYTELFITESLSEVTTPHELSQMEADSHKHIQETRIQSKDIFKPLPSEDQQEALQEPLRLVLTLGVAGVGKTFSVLKFSLDWAKGFENQDLFLVLPLSFRELNLATRGRYSLLELIHVFYPSLRPLSAQTLLHSKVLFILDGLDESRVPLDFSCEAISEVTQGSEVGPLLVNLIRGSLLPDALIWITSRPAAANQIPAECVQRLTEVRGFLTDQQREDYFCMRFSDGDHFRTVLSHIRSSRCIYTMCQIPVFCWITATVLDHMLRHPQSGALPQTLTDLYAHFLLVQTQRKRKYGAWSSVPEPSSADCDLLLKLGRLAFEHLQKGNIMFYQEDLEEVGLDLRQASLYSGLCPEIFKPQSVIFNQKVYSFVHFSVQEFMAAVYIHHCFSTKNTEVLSQFVGEDLAQSDVLVNSSLDMFLRRVMEVSLGSKTGHLDLFVRFLHGLSLESNRRALRFLLGPNKTDQETIQRVMDNLKELNLKDVSPDRSINIYHCLIEMHDQSVQQQIQDFLKTEGSEKRSLSEIQCSALAYMLQMSEQVLEELDLSKYNTSREGRWRLIPAVRNCKKAKLCRCWLSRTHLEVVFSALKSCPSHLQELDLGTNPLLSTGMDLLVSALANPNCRLTVLRLPYCCVTEAGCSALASALETSPCALRVLDLSHNELKDAGLEKVSGFLQSPHCILETLGLNSCSFSEEGCSTLGSALKTNPSHLRELDLGGNELKDAGLLCLCGFLQSPDCRLEVLGLKCCSFTQECCSSLGSALKSVPSLKTLDLTENTLCDAGLLQLGPFLQTSQLHFLSLRCCHVTKDGCSALASALDSNLSHLQELDMSYNKIFDCGVVQLCKLLQKPDCGLQALWLTYCRVSEVGCSALGSALSSGPSHLRVLDLRRNRLRDSDVKTLRGLSLDLRWQ